MEFHSSFWPIQNRWISLHPQIGTCAKYEWSNNQAFWCHLEALSLATAFFPQWILLQPNVLMDIINLTNVKLYHLNFRNVEHLQPPLISSTACGWVLNTTTSQSIQRTSRKKWIYADLRYSGWKYVVLIQFPNDSFPAGAQRCKNQLKSVKLLPLHPKFTNLKLMGSDSWSNFG